MDIAASSQIDVAWLGELDTLLSKIGGIVVLSGTGGDGRGHHVGSSIDGRTSRRLADVAALGAAGSGEASVNPASNT